MSSARRPCPVEGTITPCATAPGCPFELTVAGSVPFESSAPTEISAKAGRRSGTRSLARRRQRERRAAMAPRGSTLAGWQLAFDTHGKGAISFVDFADKLRALGYLGARSRRRGFGSRSHCPSPHRMTVLGICSS